MKFEVCQFRPATSAGKQQMQVYCRTGYHLATPAMAALARTESIYKGEKFSDHAPITVEYEFAL